MSPREKLACLATIAVTMNAHLTLVRPQGTALIEVVER